MSNQPRLPSAFTPLASLVMVALLTCVACGSSTQLVPTSDAGSDVTVGGSGGAAGADGSDASTTAGRSYSCVGGVVLPGTGGSLGSGGGGAGGVRAAAGGAGGGAGGGATGGAGGAGGGNGVVTCVVGESYCRVQSLQKVPGALPIHTCVGLTGSLAACAATPTCTCICSHGVFCLTECSCTETAGSVTVSCSQI